MINFNSEDLIVGYIKQLLKTFNLPNAKVYTEEDRVLEGQFYIKDGKIIQFKGGKEHQIIAAYERGKRYENYTSNLDSYALDYDSHTHEYLGEYLRFVRDYDKLNLMSMYNCYSNNFAKKMNKTIINNSNKYKFDVNDSDYKIIMIPVKFGKSYTIAIDSQTGYEIFCSFYGSEYYDIENLADLTFAKVSYSGFSQPKLFDSLTEDSILWNDNMNKWINSEAELKMFIKLPYSNDSTIVVLEGDYREDNSTSVRVNNPYTAIVPVTVPNFFKDYPDKERVRLTDKDFDKIKFHNLNQLLFLNSKVSHPFADRLIEYLLDNVISNADKISDNIKRVEQALYRNYKDAKPVIVGPEDAGGPNQITKDKVGLKEIGSYPGIWKGKYKALLYKLAQQEGILASKFDILGFVDKDVELNMGAEIDIYKED